MKLKTKIEQKIKYTDCGVTFKETFWCLHLLFITDESNYNCCISIRNLHCSISGKEREVKL